MRLDQAARQYLGVPFRHQGRNPSIAIDCVGLLVCAARDCGMADVLSHDSTAYGTDPAHGILEGHLQAAFGPALPVSAMQPGDVAAMFFEGAVRHVGVIAEHPDGLGLIHTNSGVGHVTEARIDAKWLRRIAGVYRPAV